MLQNALTCTYERLRFQKFSRGVHPGSPFWGKGTPRGGGEGKGGRTRDGRVERGMGMEVYRRGAGGGRGKGKEGRGREVHLVKGGKGKK